MKANPKFDNKRPVKRTSNRNGTAALESALIAPLLVLILLGAIDIGQYVNVAQCVSNCSREGARVACSNETQTKAEVTAAVLDYLGEIFPNLSETELAEAVDVTIRDETEDLVITNDLSIIDPGSQMSVLVELDFSAVRWLHGVHYFNGQFKQTTTYARRE